MFGGNAVAHRRGPLGGKILRGLPGWTQQKRNEIYERFSRSADVARSRMLIARRKLKRKLEINEAETRLRKRHRRRSLNPGANWSAMPSRELSKLIHYPASNWSSVPMKVRYSTQVPKVRIYGKLRWAKYDI